MLWNESRVKIHSFECRSTWQPVLRKLAGAQKPRMPPLEGCLKRAIEEENLSTFYSRLVIKRNAPEKDHLSKHFLQVQKDY